MDSADLVFLSGATGQGHSWPGARPGRQIPPKLEQLKKGGEAKTHETCFKLIARHAVHTDGERGVKKIPWCP